ncbi:hypothetical protein GCM10027186_56640 [Micromonospora schwarzwaldensis]
MRGEPAEAGAGLFQEGVDARTHHVMEHPQIMPITSPRRPVKRPAGSQDPADGGTLASVG